MQTLGKDQAEGGHIRFSYHRSHTPLARDACALFFPRVARHLCYCHRHLYSQCHRGLCQSGYHGRVCPQWVWGHPVLPCRNVWDCRPKQRKLSLPLATLAWKDRTPVTQRLEHNNSTRFSSQANCPKKRMSFSKNMRKSPIPYLSMAMRSTPSPKAKPLTSSG